MTLYISHFCQLTKTMAGFRVKVITHRPKRYVASFSCSYACSSNPTERTGSGEAVHTWPLLHTGPWIPFWRLFWAALNSRVASVVVVVMCLMTGRCWAHHQERLALCYGGQEFLWDGAVGKITNRPMRRSSPWHRQNITAQTDLHKRTSL